MYRILILFNFLYLVDFFDPSFVAKSCYWDLIEIIKRPSRTNARYSKEKTSHIVGLIFPRYYVKYQNLWITLYDCTFEQDAIITEFEGDIKRENSFLFLN